MSTIPLGEDLGIEASAGLKEHLAASLGEPGILRLDGSQVGRVHTAGMQVLCALFRSRRDADLRTELCEPSTALRDAARLLGLSRELGLATDDQEDKANEVEKAA